MNIYVIGSADGPKKVGVAGNPKMRLQSLQIGNPTGMSLLASFPVSGDAAFRVEQMTHSVLRNLKLRGEWFDATLDQITYAIDRAIQTVCEGKEPPEPYARPPCIVAQEPFTPQNYVAALERLCLTEVTAPRFLGHSMAQTERWATGVEEIPQSVGMLLRLITGLRLSVEDTQAWTSDDRVRQILSDEGAEAA